MNHILLRIKEFLSLYLMIELEDIFIAFVPEQVTPSDRRFVIIREISDATLMETSEYYDQENESMLLTNNNTKTVQIDFYGKDSFHNVKKTEMLLNGVLGNSYLRNYGIGCIGTENIMNLTGIDIDDKYLNRYSLTVDFNYNFDMVVNNIESFNNVSLNIKEIK